MKDSPLRVRIDETYSIRKGLLEGAVSSVEIMKKYNGYKELREKIRERRVKLAGLSDSIRSSFNNLKNKRLPKLPPEYMEKKIIEVRAPVKSVKRVEIKKYASPLDKEIDEIKRKIESLNFNY